MAVDGSAVAGWGGLEFHLSEPAKMVYLFAMSIVPTGASRVADLR